MESILEQLEEFKESIQQDISYFEQVSAEISRLSITEKSHPDILEDLNIF